MDQSFGSFGTERPGSVQLHRPQPCLRLTFTRTLTTHGTRDRGAFLAFTSEYYSSQLPAMSEPGICRVESRGFLIFSFGIGGGHTTQRIVLFCSFRPARTRQRTARTELLHERSGRRRRVKFRYIGFLGRNRQWLSEKFPRAFFWC